MAIVMSGDFDMDKTIQKIDKTFGQLPSKPFTKPQLPKEEPIKKPIIKEIFGPEAENLLLAYRFNGDSTEDKKYVALIDMLLNNSVAGLIDLDLVQQQKILKGGSYSEFYVDYGIHTFWGYPREGQSLDTVKNLLLSEIEKIKKGELDDWLLKAVVNDLRLQRIRSQENYQNRTYMMNDAFLNKEKWEDQVKYLDELDKITKDQIIKFAQEHYNDNYVIAYKRKGLDKNILKMPKPKITPVNINRNDQSAFYTDLSKQKPEPLKPVFVDFNKEIQRKEIKSGITFYYLPNKTNELFSLNIIIDMGKSSDRKLEQAVNYLQYVGTDRYTPAQVQQEFYKLGVRFGVSTGDDRSYVYITGLNKSMKQAAGLLEHLLTHAKADTASYRKYVDGVLKNRSNNKLNKGYILWGAMESYGKYGKNSAFTNILQKNELRNLNPKELTDVIKNLGIYKQKIFYYGTSEMNSALAVIQKQHPSPEIPKECIAPIKYPELDFTSRQIYFVDYDMVQANFLLMNKLIPFNQDLLPFSELYNTYYSGIVFQEIREARGLAYSAGSWIETPDRKDKSFYSTSFVATQSDKLREATSNVLLLVNNMKEDQRQFDLAKESILNRIETERITKSDIFWTYLSNLDKGITKDIRKDIYEKVKNLDMADLKSFMEKYSARNYTLLVIGKKGMIDANVLKKLGEYQELTLNEIFNY
jgi:predicted Zn-dependent peptidase